MKGVFGGKSIVRFVFACTLLVMVPASQAQSAANLDKHSRKIHKQLVKYRTGTYVNLAFRDGSASTGMLSTVSETSFTINNADNNVPETHFYSEVASANQGKEYIGDGSGRRHHIHLWVPVVVGAVAAGAAMTVVAVR
ncbi:MAG TPA: hypothetical protein VL991_00325 [Terracidiphilus sp.]|nr:hypothetical protein [Terracidiphilus sp.]